MLLQNLHKIILGSTILQNHSVEDDDTGFKIVDNVRIDEYFFINPFSHKSTRNSITPNYIDCKDLCDYPPI